MDNDMQKVIRHLGAQIEETNSNVRAILEIVVPMQQDVIQLKKDVGLLKEEMIEVKADIRTMKVALTAGSKDVKDHERRITRLESKPA
jgi:chromosome segregation ATPase